MPSQLFATKSIADLQEADASGHTAFNRTLSATALTASVSAASSAPGIFVLTGTAAANHAGPALALAFIVAASAASFAGLCYAEFAAMIPVSGSAYSYTYATLGEVIAWFIGWNLILEYLFAVATVSVGWSGYLVSLLDQFGVHLPSRSPARPSRRATAGDASRSCAPAPCSICRPGHRGALATICYIGIRQSATFNTVIVAIKVASW